MGKFKVGDYVVCVDPADDLVKGATYVVREYSLDESMVGVNYLDGDPVMDFTSILFYAWRFVLLSDYVSVKQQSASNAVTPNPNTLTAHYDFFYTLTEQEKASGVLKIDPYFVSSQWKLGSKDESGALWHCFKTIARFGEKNPVEREIKALHTQVKRLAELHGVSL